METLYWALEYGKVLIAYIAVMFIWPSVVFGGYLKGKSRSVRFCFCVTVQVVLVNTVVLGLGLLHLLHGWLVALLFYGSFFGVLLYRFRVTEELRQTVIRLVTGTYGIRLFMSDMRTRFRNWRRRRREAFLQSARGHIAEYVVLAVVVLFGMIYFTYGAFCDHSYGFGDMYRHHSWIYGLLEGTPFYEGIYPEAMHCFIYSLRVLFGVSIYSSQLFLAGVHVAVFLVAAYLFLKELFAWRGTAILVLAMFLTVDLVCIDEIFSMSRLQWTLPQEFGLYTEFLCALFLLRCLKADFTDIPKGIGRKLKYLFTNENLLLFMMSLAASLVIHFYATMMAFFLCLVVAGCRFVSCFRKKRLLPLMAAVTAGLFIAVAPMGLALAEGIGFQGSISWAVNIINGTDTNEGRTNQIKKQETTETPTPGEQGTTEVPAPGGQETGGTGAEAQGQVPAPGETTGMSDGAVTGQGDITSQDGPEQPASPGFTERLREKLAQIGGIFRRVWEIIREKSAGVYSYGYVTLYRSERAAWIVGFTALGLAFWLCYRLITALVALIFRGKLRNGRLLTFFDGYPLLVLMSAFFMLLYAAPFLGLPELIAGSRLCSTEQLLILAVIAIPADAVLATLAQTGARRAMPVLLILGVGGIYVAARQLGFYHGYLYNELTRYNSVVRVTNEIMDSFPEHSYTIVSPTDELYHVIEKGRHEELFQFMLRTTGENYTIPTEYVFLYVEKKPIRYAQSHFQTGPAWLAEEKYTQYYSTNYSEGGAISASEISETAAAEPLRTYSKLSQNYSNLESRTILESKAYLWFESFSALYPQETAIYYEDDDFVCYLIRQNVYRLFQLEAQ